MIELKQLQFFIACAETGSFSKAAERLYTTQPNVSKTIKAMETELGVDLFARGKNGIVLTEKGKHVYDHAGKVMDEMDFLRDFSDTKEDTWLRISCTPSSKLADLFVEFYQRHAETDVHYRVYSTSVNSVLQRMRDNKDDIGVVFVEEGKENAMEYLLLRYHLEFIPLKTVESVLYLGRGGDTETPADLIGSDGKLRLVQSYYDEISNNRDKAMLDQNGISVGTLDPVVVTNSDYIMERVLKRTSLANISGASILRDIKDISGRDQSGAEHESCCISPDGSGNGNNMEDLHSTGIVIRDNKVTFGIVIRKGEELQDWSLKFVRFLKEMI